MSYIYKIVPSPVGNLKLVGSDKGLAAILWENDNAATCAHVARTLKTMNILYSWKPNGN